MITTSPVPTGENPPGATAPSPVHKPAPSPLPGSGPQPPVESEAVLNESIRGGPAHDSYRPPGWQPVFQRGLKMILESRGRKVPP